MLRTQYSSMWLFVCPFRRWLSVGSLLLWSAPLFFPCIGPPQLSAILLSYGCMIHLLLFYWSIWIAVQGSLLTVSCNLTLMSAGGFITLLSLSFLLSRLTLKLCACFLTFPSSFWHHSVIFQEFRSFPSMLHPITSILLKVPVSFGCFVCHWPPILHF